MVRLLDVDPDLGGLLNQSRREQAERELVVRTHRLPVGPWDVSRLAGATADHVGLLIIDGILSRELVVADHVSAELLGPGDLVRPWQPASRTGLLPVDAVWTVMSPLSRRRARPPLRGGDDALPGDHRDAVRPPERALAAAGHHAGDLAAHARRPAAEGALLAPRRALGPRVRRRRDRPAGAHAPDPRPARRRAPADRLDGAVGAGRARGARRAGPTARGCCAAIRRTPSRWPASRRPPRPPARRT